MAAYNDDRPGGGANYINDAQNGGGTTNDVSGPGIGPTPRSGGNYPGGGGTTTPALDANGNPVGPNTYDFDINSFYIGPNGSLFGQKRTFSADPNTPGGQRYDYKEVNLGDASNLDAIAAATGIPKEALQAKMPEWQAAKNKFTLGQGVTVDPDGTIWLQKGDGSRAPVTKEAIAAGQVPGVTMGDLAQAQSRSASDTANLNRMGQYQVIGMNQDGSLTVRDGMNRISTVTKQMVDAGQVPGVTSGEFTQAQSQQISSQANINRAGQFSFAGVDPQTGGVLLKDGQNRLVTTSVADATSGKYPGVNALEVQQGIQQANTSNWQNQAVGSTMNGVSYQVPTYNAAATTNGTGVNLSGGAGGILPPGATPPAGTAPPGGRNPDGSLPTPGLPPPLYARTDNAHQGSGGAYQQPTHPPGQQTAPDQANDSGAPALPIGGSGAGTWGSAPTASSSTASHPPGTPSTPPATPWGRMAGGPMTQPTTPTQPTAQATTSPYQASYAAAARGYGGPMTNPGSGTSAPGTPGSGSGGSNYATGGGGIWGMNNQELGQANTTRQNVYNYARAQQNILTNGLAGQSRDTSGTGFGSISSRQVLAGQ